ncbi:MAG: hypothetical protein K2W96_04610 [Gemmataceae bacterium]|nr:hypothetical protein [Gemmataceae bacterium]
MPLLDHFRPPLLEDAPWEGFFSAWAVSVAGHLNRHLPPRFAALPFTAHRSLAAVADGPATWSPGEPARSETVDWSMRDLFEVRVMDHREGSPRLVGAVELVSPANKDRPAARRTFAGKGAGYLRSNIGLVVVDVVTVRQQDLHRELLELLELDAEAEEVEPLYAGAYRTVGTGAARLDMWPQRLRVGGELPTLPLWLSPELAVPVDLAASYAAACEMLRIE